MKVGFIGLGVMGAPMAANILKGGHELTVYDRSAEAVARLVQACSSRSDVALLGAQHHHRWPIVGEYPNIHNHIDGFR